MNARRIGSVVLIASLVSSLIALQQAGGAGAGPTSSSGPIVGRAESFFLSPAARTLPAPRAAKHAGPIQSRVNPHVGGAGGQVVAAQDPLVAPLGPGLAPPLSLRFRGVGNPFACQGCSPPDPNGDVGPDNYVQMVNATKVAVFDKTGHLFAPVFDLGDLWPSGTCTGNAGDPIVRYDGRADRWLLSQFNGASTMCVAISQTPDPGGAYFLYAFNVGSFPDYFKFGVWPDAYYMAANESSYTAYAFDRAKMLAGDPSATFVKFIHETNFLMPVDLDGPTPPPPGAAGYFSTFKDDAFHGGADRIELFRLHADFADPPSSTFTLEDTFPIASFTYTVCGFFEFDCVRQRGTAQRIDVVSEWPMQRFPYRNFGTHETLLGDFTVGGGLGETGAAIRWFELRNDGGGWTLFQEGTLDPGDGNDRFMGSIAMDGAGNVALGYSVSSSQIFPSIRYTTRSPSDPPGTMRREATMVRGLGSQTGSDRWGDYTAMAIDPADDCTFWYTNEYYQRDSSSNWSTSIGAFAMPGC